MIDNQELVLPYNKGNLLPKNNLDRGLFVLMSVCIPALTLWELITLFRYRPEKDFIFIANLFFQLFTFANMIGNLYYLQRVDSSGKHKNLPAVLNVQHSNWRYCPFCQMNSPPRSYHCPICNECILKRDQHCMFAGCCVGFYNHRYYFVALVYIIMGSLYAAILQWPHFLEAIGGFQILPMVSMIAPHIAVLLGFLSIYGFICAIAQIFLSLVFLLTSYLLVVQIRCISQGQTIHEKRSGITLYDLGWRRNFLQVLGKRWYWALVSPLATSSVEGDGVHFLTFYDLTEVKNV